MKYVNAAEILPERLLRELQTYIDGDVLYVDRHPKRNGGLSAAPAAFTGSGTGRSGGFTERGIPWKRCLNSMAWPTAPSGKSYMDDQGMSARELAGVLFVRFTQDCL